ncbi:hypothetical protein ACTFIU_007155 [Dictyostelium citrinum]
MICGTYNSTVFQLGYYDTVNITYSKDGVMVTYVSSQTPANGWCTCDQYTQGTNCNQLKASISSVIAPQLMVVMTSITITIGSLVCGQFSFSANSTQISCNIGAGFYYHYPCSEECSHYGTCNDVIGSCVCNFNYAVGPDYGGQAYLISNFSNVIGRTLAVKIGTQQCTNINFNQTTLECTIGSGEGIKDIVITSD